MFYLKKEAGTHRKESASFKTKKEAADHSKETASFSPEPYYYALCVKPPRHKFLRHSDGTPMLDDNWHLIKNIEKDYGWNALKQGWTRIYRLLSRHAEIEERCFSREKGWTPKHFDSYQEWKANSYRNRAKYYDRTIGTGRWHLHALISSPVPLSCAALKRKILEIIGSKNYYLVDLAPVRNLKAYIRYIERNAAETIRPKGQKHIRLRAKKLQKKSELFFVKNSLQLLQSVSIARKEPLCAFIAIYTHSLIFSLTRHLETSGRSPP